MDSSVEYFKKKIDDHLYKEMELMIEMYESNLTDEEWVEIRESMLAHPQHEIASLLKKACSDARINPSSRIEICTRPQWDSVL